MANNWWDDPADSTEPAPTPERVPVGRIAVGKIDMSEQAPERVAVGRIPVGKIENMTTPLGGSNDFRTALDQMAAVPETAANMFSALPGMAAGGWAAAGQGLLALPEAVGLPGIGGASMSKVGDVYKQTEDYVNNKLFGPGIQYAPESESGKMLTQKIGEYAEKGVHAVGDAGEAVGGSAGRAIAQTGAEALLALGPPKGLAAGIGKLRPKKGEIRVPESELSTKIDEMLAKKEEVPPAAPPVAEPIPTSRQGDLALDPRQGIDTTDVRNPYDMGGDVTRLKQGMDTPMERVQGELFSPDEPRLRPEILDEAKGMEGLVEGLDNPRTERPPASTDVKSGMVSWFKVADDGTVNLRETLRSLLTQPLSETTFPGYKALASRMINYLEDSGVTVRVVESLDDTGLYRGGQHDVLLRRGSGNNNYVLMHELVHAATSRWIRMNATHPLVKQLTTINEALRKAIGDEHYGVKDVHELVSEAETNPIFAQRMGETTITRNLFQRLKDTIDNIRQGQFKIAPKEWNALQRALENSKQIMEKQAAPDFQWDPKRAQKNALTNGPDGKPLPPHPTRQRPPLDTPLRQGRSSEFEANQALGAGKGNVWERADQYNRYSNASDFTGHSPEVTKAGETIMKDPSKSTAPEAAPERAKGAYSRVPGLEGMAQHISKDQPVPKIIAKVMELPDLVNTWRGAIGGKEMIAAIKNNPAIYWLGSMLTNAGKRADLYQGHVLSPLTKELAKITRQEGDRLALIMKKEMFAEKRLTPEQLAELGLSAKTIEAYHKLRGEFDIALKKMNDERARTNQPPVPAHEAYLSSRWNGDWKTPVYDKTGKLVWYIAETSRARAEHALKYLADAYPELDISKSKVEYSKRYFLTEESTTMATLTDMINTLGRDDPAVKAMMEANAARLAEEGSNVLGQKKHMEPKSGTRGFLGDQPWKSERQNTVDLFNSQMQYLSNTHRWAETQGAVRQINEVLQHPDVIAQRPNFVKLMNSIKQSELGNPTVNWLAELERDMSKVLGHVAWAGSKAFPPLTHLPTDLAAINRGMGVAKSYFFVSTLGMFNVPFALMSLAQPIFTLPHHVRLSREGFNHNPFQTMMDSIMGGVGAVKKSFGGEARLEGLQKEAYEYMKANGIGDLNQFSDVHDIGHSQAYNKAKKVAGWSMTEAERVSRSMAFMGYVSHLEQSGKYRGDHHALFQHAEMLTDKSMVNYRHTERANVFNKAGLVGNAASALHTFPVNQWNQLYDMAKYTGRTKDPTPLLAMLATQMVMAGGLGIYGIDMVDDLYNYFKEAAVNKGWLTDPKKIEWSPKHALAKHLPEVASYGLFSQAMGGRNFGTRMSAGQPITADTSGIFPFISDYADKISAVGTLLADLFRGTDVSKSGTKALHELAPSSLKPVVEMNTGMTSPEGSPMDKDREGLAYRRTPQDVEMKKGIGGGFAGMQTTTEHKAREEDYRYKQATALKGKAATIQADRFKTAVKAGNGPKAADAIRNYVKLGGDDESLINSLTANEVRKFFTEDEWKAFNATSTRSLRELADRLEFKGVR